MVGVYCMSPDQGEPVYETFLLQLQEAFCSQAILMGDFNHLDVCWESNTAGCKKSRKLLECINDNFLVQVLEKPNRGEALLNLVLTNADELTKGVKVGGSLGCSDHALVEFVISRSVNLVRSKVKTLNFTRTNFQLFKELVNEIPWAEACSDRWSAMRDFGEC
ncbi:hypothetical protein BTVI_38929 [Pitangus sulphuratus]|nr:hypothetical protein BTVI_38929 [Pitangus sulphuratus]